MIDRLSIPSLLKLLVFNQKNEFFWHEHADVDNFSINSSQRPKLTSNVGQRAKADVVRQLCERAEVFRRSQRYKEAVEIATEATRIAHDAFDHNLQGIALLHLSAARAASGKPELDKRAISDCNRAIRDFCLESHNYSIALIIRAQIQLQLHQTTGNEIALSYLRQASRALGKIIVEFHGPDKVTAIALYQGLKGEVDAVIDNLVSSRTEISPQPIAPKQIVRSVAPHDKFVDVLSGSVQVLARQLIPIFSVSARAGPAQGGYTDESTDDCLEISDQILVQGRPYFLRWADDKKRVRHAFQLREDRDYVVVLVEGQSMQPTLKPNEYVLVRKQDYHDFDGQLVVASLGVQNENNPVQHIVKRARGYPNIRWLESDNPNKASFPPIAPAAPDIQASLLGVVEVILTPNR